MWGGLAEWEMHAEVAEQGGTGSETEEGGGTPEEAEMGHRWDTSTSRS